jgi:hypothetical protein
MWQSREYHAWGSMKQRCFNKKCHIYKWYGGRGITVCPEWRNSFENFLESVGPRPSSAHSLGRINNDGNYEPGNVEWQTVDKQKRNTRANRFFRFQGKSKILKDWAEQFGLYHRTVESRIQHGWTIKEALTVPVAHEMYAKNKRRN